MFSLLQTLQSIETAPDIISWESIEQISKILNIQLTVAEQDYLTLSYVQRKQRYQKITVSGYAEKIRGN